MRVDLHEVDAVVETALEASVHVATLRRQLGRLDHAKEIARAIADQLSARRADGDGAASVARLRPLVDELSRALEGAQRTLETRADQAERELEEIRRAADRLRLLPARAISGPLERAARDAARALDRAVTFELAGGGVRVDANVLTAMREALLHAVRNAVAHGIEPARGARAPEASRRRAASAWRSSGAGPASCSAAATTAAAWTSRRCGRPRRARGSSPRARPPALDDAALTALLLRGGISTSATVTDVSGRGVGLDVVRDVAARLQAEVALRTERGRGTDVEVVVPVSLTALTALQVEASRRGGGAAARRGPQRDVPRVEQGDADGGGRRRRLPRRARAVRAARERARATPAGEPRRAWSAVVVEAPRRPRRRSGPIGSSAPPRSSFARCPRSCSSIPAWRAAALDGEGNPRLVLDPGGARRGRARPRPGEQEAPAPRAPILVIDDSLTTRMLEQSILESAGYEVDVAVSAEEALDKARARRFGLFLVDVEMPGMDGFEFVRVTRAEPRLSSTPAILVTSRSAPEDRARGLGAGASAYIVKSEFDQGRLLATIEELLQVTCRSACSSWRTRSPSASASWRCSRRIPSSWWWGRRRTGGAASSCASGCARTS